MQFSLYNLFPSFFGSGLSLAVLGSLIMPLFAEAQTLPSRVDISSGDYSESLSSSDLVSWFRVETKLVPKKDRSEAVDTTYCPVDALYCDIFLSRYTRARLAVTFDSAIDRDALAVFVSELAGRVSQEPADAIFGVAEDDKIIIAKEEQLGRRLKEAESVTLLTQALERAVDVPLKISLPTETVTPKIVSADRERLGLHELIGEGKSNFKGSPKNRIFNIKRALEQYQNILIAPGEEFSFVDYLGEVDGEHGYLPELVIKYNKTEPEFGGGICQVSSTVFRAAIYSGLKITERRNHAYAVQYYKPIGMDATIYIPKPDLKFTNNTPGYILMQPTVTDFDLTFRFFGTKDGRSVKVDGPRVLERGGDGSMKTVFTQEVNTDDGQNFIRDSFYSNYKSPSLFPHPGEEPNLTTKPKDWSEKQWKAYKAIRP